MREKNCPAVLIILVYSNANSTRTFPRTMTAAKPLFLCGKTNKIQTFIENILFDHSIYTLETESISMRKREAISELDKFAGVS